jgi:hypothetical protein
MFGVGTHTCACTEAGFVAQTELSPVEYWGIIVAAGAGVVGVLIATFAIYQNHRANKDAAQRDEKMTKTLGGMAVDIDRLAAITEDTASRAPLPTLAFLIDQEPSPDIGFKLKVPKHVDTESVLSAALHYAQESRPVILPGRHWAGILEEPTQGEVERYDAKVSRYMERLPAKLVELDEWEREMASLIVVHLRLGNDGAVPLEDGRVVLRIPDGLLHREGVPASPELPELPVFQSRYLSFASFTPTTFDHLYPDSDSPWQLSSGFQLKTRDIVEWEAGDVQHGGHLDSAPLVLAAERSGEFTLEWRVHADNLGQPQTGTLRVVVAPADATPPQMLTTLDDVGLGEEEDEEDED